MKSAIRKKEKEKKRREKAPQTIPLLPLWPIVRAQAAVLRDQARNAEILQQYLGRVVELFIGESLFDPRLSRSMDNRIGFNSSTERTCLNPYNGNQGLLLLENY